MESYIWWSSADHFSRFSLNPLNVDWFWLKIEILLFLSTLCVCMFLFFVCVCVHVSVEYGGREEEGVCVWGEAAVGRREAGWEVEPDSQSYPPKYGSKNIKRTFWDHSWKKCFCLWEPVFWGGILLILRRNFPNMEEDFPNIEEKCS